MKFKRFEELTISDNYMFSAVFSDPYLTAQLICRILPEEKLSPDEIIVKEKYIKNAYRSRAVVFDVYRKDNTHLFDLEMQVKDDTFLLDRAFYNMCAMVVDSHEPGEEYELRFKTYVVFICAFDKTKTGRLVEHYEMSNEDKKSTIGKGHIIVVNCAVEAEDNKQLKPFAKHVMNGNTDTDDLFVQEVNTALEWKRRDRREQELYMEWQYELDKAKEEGRLNTLLSLYQKGRLDLNGVLEETGFTEEELKIALKEYLNDQ
ncbi:MAG: PD-(D/E)XK nuclease family transposase [Solobacterium sp.]|nr:PD-(D/E)XK nuclease family transposase [Solobacterium sp.]